MATGHPTGRVPLALPAEIVPKAIAGRVAKANSHRAATVPREIVDRAPRATARRVEIADPAPKAATSIRRVASRAVPARAAAIAALRADSVAATVDLVAAAIAPTVEIAVLASGSIVRSRIRADLASRPLWKASWRSSAASKRRSRTTSSWPSR